jgi:hypothetical protein
MTSKPLSASTRTRYLDAPDAELQSRFAHGLHKGGHKHE